MTWLAFISAIIASIAWPAALVTIMLSFRKEFVSIFNRLVKAKGFGGEIEFAQQLDKAETLVPLKLDVSQVAPTLENAALDSDSIVKDSDQNVDNEKISMKSYVNNRKNLPPSYKIITTWNILSSFLREESIRRGLKTPSFWGNSAIRRVGPLLGLAPQDLTQIEQLRNLRNRAAHGLDEDISITDALRYEDIVLSILERIHSVRNEKK